MNTFGEHHSVSQACSVISCRIAIKVDERTWCLWYETFWLLTIAGTSADALHW